MRSPLQEFLIARKLELLNKEKRATGIAQTAMLAQIQMTEAILGFLATQQTEEDMAKLQLTLDTQATPVDDIKPRQDNQELTEGLIELAEKLEKDWELEVKRAKKAGEQPKDIKYPLNNLPDDIKPKSVSTKIYALRSQKKLPENILPAMRTIKEKQMVKNKTTGEQEEVEVVKEIIYMKWVKNPPAVKVDGEGN